MHCHCRLDRLFIDSDNPDRLPYSLALREDMKSLMADPEEIPLREVPNDLTLSLN